LQSAESQTDAISVGYALTQHNQVVFVRVSSSTGCYQIVKIALTLMRSPVVALPDAIPMCKNLGNVIIHAGNFDSYLWSTGETTSSISVTTPGPYWVTVTENNGAVDCAATKDFNVFWSDVATILAIQIQEWTADQNTIVIVVENPDQFEFSLDGVVYQSSNTFTNLPAGSYTVYVRDKDRCGITNGEVVLLMYPKYFTPNGDGVNDYWHIKFAELDQSEIVIFDRYGKLLTKLTGNDQGWDGKYDGEFLPASDYWFVVTKANGTQHRGHFSLKR
jgi:gliding motility-associated-like protein